MPALLGVCIENQVRRGLVRQGFWAKIWSCKGVAQGLAGGLSPIVQSGRVWSGRGSKILNAPPTKNISALFFIMLSESVPRGPQLVIS